MNDTMRESVLIPTKIVLAVSPSFPNMAVLLRTKNEKMKPSKSAQTEMSTIVPEQPAKNVLNRPLAPATYRRYNSGEEIQL